MENGNIDCLHPVQCVVDALCGENRDGYAQQLENWFDAYATKRGMKAKMFKPTSGCVPLEKFITIQAVQNGIDVGFDEDTTCWEHGVLNTDLMCMSLSSRLSMSLWRMIPSSFP